MGGWKLETGKMAIYIGFPVVLFYIFNQPKYFEDWIDQKRKELYPPSPEREIIAKQLREFAKTYNAKKEEELLKKLSEIDENR